jgi:hypothetical protein
MPRTTKFSEDYQEKCFQVWYLAGRPTYAKRFQELIPEDEHGRKPTPVVIYRWQKDGTWDLRADELDAKAIQTSEESLVIEKAEILRRHQEAAKQVQIKALEYLMTEGFDTSAAAVNALFKGMDMERQAAQFADLLEKLDRMDNNQVRDKIIDLVNRAASNNQIVDGEEVGALPAPDDDTVSTEDEQ